MTSFHGQGPGQAGLVTGRHLGTRSHMLYCTQAHIHARAQGTRDICPAGVSALALPVAHPLPYLDPHVSALAALPTPPTASEPNLLGLSFHVQVRARESLQGFHFCFVLWFSQRPRRRSEAQPTDFLSHTCLCLINYCSTHCQRPHIHP